MRLWKVVIHHLSGHRWCLSWAAAFRGRLEPQLRILQFLLVQKFARSKAQFLAQHGLNQHVWLFISGLWCACLGTRPSTHDRLATASWRTILIHTWNWSLYGISYFCREIQGSFRIYKLAHDRESAATCLSGTLRSCCGQSPQLMGVVTIIALFLLQFCLFFAYKTFSIRSSSSGIGDMFYGPAAFTMVLRKQYSVLLVLWSVDSCLWSTFTDLLLEVIMEVIVLQPCCLYNFHCSSGRFLPFRRSFVCRWWFDDIFIYQEVLGSKVLDYPLCISLTVLDEIALLVVCNVRRSFRSRRQIAVAQNRVLSQVSSRFLRWWSHTSAG